MGKTTKDDTKDVDFKHKSTKGKNPRSRSSKRPDKKYRDEGDRRGANSATRDFISSTGKPTNDPKWYLNNPVLSRDVGSIWFSRPTGKALPHSAVTVSGIPTGAEDTYDPGIVAIPSILTWGGTVESGLGIGSVNNAMNLTAQKLYQFVVHANSRNISYDKKDLMMSLCAIDAVYQVITEAIRAYRLIANYDPENMYVSHLLTALHWDYDALKANVAEFRYMINWAITRVNKFFMPRLFDMIKSHVSAYENIYLDRPSTKGQMFAKYSAGVWLYDDIEGTMQYCDEFVPLSGGSVPWTGLRTPYIFNRVVTDMIARIENSQYIGVMQGDLLKAFGMENMSQYAYVGIDLPIVPVYDEEFLYKFHNADISYYNPTFSYDTANTHRSYMIMRDTDAVDGNIRVLRRSALMPSDFNTVRIAEGAMIDLPTGVAATPENLLLMSLYKLHPEYSTNAKWCLSDTSPAVQIEGYVPPEILLPSTIYLTPTDMSITAPLTTYLGDNIYVLGYISRFRHHPLLTTLGRADNDPGSIVWDTDNVGPVSWRLLDRMLDVVFWSLWASSEISSSDSRDTRV